MKPGFSWKNCIHQTICLNKKRTHYQITSYYTFYHVTLRKLRNFTKRAALILQQQFKSKPIKISEDLQRTITTNKTIAFHFILFSFTKRRETLRNLVFTKNKQQKRGRESEIGMIYMNLFFLYSSNSSEQPSAHTSGVFMCKNIITFSLVIKCVISTN